MENLKLEKRFKIDFYELSFLIEACIPPTTIARISFWNDVIDKYYFELFEDERKMLFDWINMNYNYKEKLIEKNEDIIKFNERFNPYNKYIVYDNNLKIINDDCFKIDDKFYVSKDTYINSNEISFKEKIN